jgi:hypothetical protein
MKRWYCYFCGKILKDKYHLVGCSKSTDRVFLVCRKCYDRNLIDKDYISIGVTENG